VQLGLSARPPDGTVWGLGLAVHDRDDAAGTAIAAKTWPETADGNSTSSWGRLRFGLTTYTPPAPTPAGTVTVRHGLNGAVVRDAGVGGYTQCGASFDYWSQWGDLNETAYNNPPTDFNVQNQSDVSDYPCFSKIYLTFPLTQVPAGKVIHSATLTLHQMGNSGVSGPGQPPATSIIQVLTTGTDWNPLTITWNSAPLALENFSRTSVGVIEGCGSTIPWPCVPRTFDVSEPVARAYLQGTSLGLVLYSADSLYGTGKYFTSSDVDASWNAVGRPTLVVNWNP
ncbi:MAG: DNRLRE domain-containing protein, partial [Anaerolineales bacterium]